MFEEPWEEGRVGAPSIVEASGLVASAKTPGVLWVHNDSGDGARLFAVRRDGALVAALDVRGAAARDWEAMAAGPGAGGAPALYVGDIGDNDAARASVTIYVVPEPALDPPPSSVTVERVVELRYEDGPRDAEALLVDPESGEIVIVSKARDGASGVYVADVQAGLLSRRRTLAVGRAPLAGDPRVTDGAVSRRGDLVALRTYDAVFVWRRAPGTSIADALGGEPCGAPAPREPQGEAIAFAADGSGYFTVSEGAAPPIWFFEARGR